MKHAFFGGLALLALTACTNPDDLDAPVTPLGDFNLGHNVVVAPNLTKGPASRDASAEEWIDAMKSAVDARFSRYEGDKLYHIAISIEGYVLAVSGIPLVAAPKSALILRVTVWDDAAGEKLNAEPEQITVIETISGNTVLGSGFTQTKAVQMENLSQNAAKLIQNWLVRENARNGWFGSQAAEDAPVTELATETPAPRKAASARPKARPATIARDAITPEAPAPEAAADTAAPGADPDVEATGTGDGAD